MAYRHVVSKLYGKEHVKGKKNGLLNTLLYHSVVEEPHEVLLPAACHKNAYAKMSKLSHLLKDLDEVDGRLVNINDDSTVFDSLLEHKMHKFKSLVRAFIGSPAVQLNLKRSSMASSLGSSSAPSGYFSQSCDRQPIIIHSLTQVNDLLNVSPQQRKLVRQTICAQVTQQKIWMGAITEILNYLKMDLDYFIQKCPSKSISWGQQIVSACLKFLEETGTNSEWMRLRPTKSLEAPDLRKWGDVLEMFNHLINCLSREEGLMPHVRKLEEMKEGLIQIRDVLVDKNIGYNDSRHQDILLQKKLSNSFGHSSPCFFTLLYYYLYGRIGTISVDLQGGVCGAADGSNMSIYMGRILTSAQEHSLWNGIKQLDKVLGLFKFVWEIAGMKGNLELQGHLWCVEAEDSVLAYRGNSFVLHGIRQ
ncbi:hypothetical protein SAY87_021255 [Trapa incisa]|uniref:Uncharacterized protein n=1 Tax=Trapa incisa TaxID=236973 RepID=A0AAN7JST3_9MYRT|nr:hypothetical protein SAY87_021255 [Trapa incisa]